MTTAAPARTRTTSYRLIPLDQIHADPRNPREREVADEEMVASIREHGIVQPLIVRPADSGSGYTIIAGHRRRNGAKQAGLSEAPCVVSEGLAADEVLAIQLIENVHREELNPIEQAKAIRRIQQEVVKGGTQREVGKLVGLNQATVSRLLLLLKLAPHLQAQVAAGTLSVTSALGYDRAPSQRMMTSRGAATIHPDVARALTAVKAMGRAVATDDELAARRHALDAYRGLKRWLPRTATAASHPGTDAGPEEADEHAGPMTPCPYCKDKLDVEHPAGAKERIEALTIHLNESDRCARKHRRALGRPHGAPG